MKINRLSHARALGGALVIAVVMAGSATAGFVQPVAPSWDGGPNTTAQIWGTMVPGASVPTAATPQSPTDSASNPNGTAGWYDSTAPGDGVFAAGPDAYSFSAAITPTATIPGYDLPGHTLNVFAEAQSYGSLIDTDDLTASYTDLTGPHSILVSSLPSYQYTKIFDSGPSDIGFGPASTVDHQWTFSLPTDVSNLQLTWGWDVPSAAIQGLSVYTQSVPEPESILLALLGVAGVLIAGRGFRRSRGGRVVAAAAE